MKRQRPMHFNPPKPWLRVHKTLILCVFIVFCVPFSAWGQLAKPFQPKVSHQDTYAESMTAIADFEDGTYTLNVNTKEFKMKWSSCLKTAELWVRWAKNKWGTLTGTPFQRGDSKGAGQCASGPAPPPCP